MKDHRLNTTTNGEVKNNAAEGETHNESESSATDRQDESYIKNTRVPGVLSFV